MSDMIGDKDETAIVIIGCAIIGSWLIFTAALAYESLHFIAKYW